MENQKVKTILKSVAIILILFAIVFALRAQAVDINGVPNEIKANYVDVNGLPYFSEMDSYFNLRLTENYIDHGYFGDTLVNGTGWDMHSYYPTGRDVGSYQPMIAWITAALYGFVNMFQEMSITEVAFWTGAFIASFAVIPAYIFVRRIINDYGAIAAALLVALGPNYFSHTFAGFFDTDMFNVTLPLFFILFFVESMRCKKLSHRIIFALLSVASIGIYSLSWTGFMFYPAVMILVMIVFFILCFYLKIRIIESPKSYTNKLQWLTNQKELFSPLVIVVVGVIGLIATVGIDGILSGIGGLTGSLSLQAAASTNVWPNVFVSVAEMQIPNVLVGGIAGAFLANTGGVVNGIGGIVCLFGVLIVLFTFAQRIIRLNSVQIKDDDKKPPKSKRESTSLGTEQNKFRIYLKDVGTFGSADEINRSKRLTVLYLSLFFVWIISSLIAVSQGTRFIQVLVVPMGLCAGIFAGYAADYVKSNIDDERILMVLAFCCAFLIAFPITQLSIVTANANLIAILVFIILVAISAVAIIGMKALRDSDVSIKKTLVVVLITLALVSPTVCGAYYTAETVVPGSSDPMWQAMDYVHENSTNDTVLVSWWDFGYLFQIASDHPTAFDGGSQTGPRAYWVGRLLTTSDFDLSKGILEMLATTGDNATFLLADYTGSNATAVEGLNKILPMDKSVAQKTLVKDYNLTSKEANDVVTLSHPANPNNVSLILSSDMVQKAGWWSYFGSWDFTNLKSTNYQYYMASAYSQIQPNSVGKVNILNESGIEYNAVIDRTGGNNSTTAQVECVWTNNGTPVDLNGTSYNNPLKANDLILVQNGYLIYNGTINGTNGTNSTGDSANGNYTLYVIGQGNSYTAILMDGHLRNSVFTSLFLLGGAGQNTFELSNMQDGVAVWAIKDSGSSGGSLNNSTA